MSMIMMLQRIAEEAGMVAEKPAVAIGQQPISTTLKIFNGNDADESSDVDLGQLLPAVLGSFISELNSAQEDSEGEDGFGPEGEQLCLEKAWHGLHFLLTGDAWGGTGSRAFLVNGGSEQEEDFGYGPARLFSVQETAAIARELKGIEADDLWSKYDAQAMTNAGIYPEIWDEPSDELEEEYCDCFEQLKEFATEAARQGDELLVFLT